MAGSELSALAKELETAPSRFIPDVVKVFRDEGKEFRNAWRRNAKITSGQHGRQYPRSITSELKTRGATIIVDVGPTGGNTGGHGHGGMGRGFEFGGQNQRPHLDGYKALPKAESEFANKSADAIDAHIPGMDR